MNYIADYLNGIIEDNAQPDALNWLEDTREKLQEKVSALYIGFSASSRYFQKTPLNLSSAEAEKAQTLCPGFQPGGWDLLQTVRVYILLEYPFTAADEQLDVFTKLFDSADIHEQVSLYSSLPLLPYQKVMVPQAREGLRTNITTVFDAIALQNPFPAQYFSEEAWNQMVLKAVFMQRPLYKIYGADERTNAQLATMLILFAHERWAAGRKVMPELWRFVGPFIDESNFADIEKVISEGDGLEVEAAYLACETSNYQKAVQIRKEIDQNNVGSADERWQQIGEQFYLQHS